MDSWWEEEFELVFTRLDTSHMDGEGYQVFFFFFLDDVVFMLLEIGVA